MIAGVTLTPLQQITDARGSVMHMLKRSSPVFREFGEIYFSCVNPQAIKAWHLHERMTMNVAVPVGRVRLVLYDDRPNSPTKGQVEEILLGPDHYQLVTIPPQVWNGFQALGKEGAVVANCASIEHDPGEIRRLEPSDPYIPYRWIATPA